MIFGAHCSTAGGVHMALRRAVQIGASACQVFVKNNMQWFGRAYEESEIAAYRSEPHSLSAVFGHTGYLINLGSPPSPNRDNSLKSLIQEIELATQLGIPFLVLHPGAHLGAGENEGIRRIVSGLEEAFSATRRSPVKLALENTAGQGTCLGNRLEHLTEIFERVGQTGRLGICLDTAHFYAAGYPVHQLRGWDAAIGEIEKRIGLDQILSFHLNDSKTELGSRVDRHAHIGEGKIGLNGFQHIVNDPRFRNHPGCLETPKSKDLHEDIRNLETLRSLLKKPRSKRALKPTKR